MLFADRARQVDSRFVLDGQAGPGRMQSDSENPDAPAGVLYHGQDVSLGAIEKAGCEEVRPDAHRPGPLEPAALGPERLSARERELVTLVAQGRTDAQIAEQLSISIRTVRSNLDRIRDKTGCRRRADLTRLALLAGLI